MPGKKGRKHFAWTKMLDKDILVLVSSGKKMSAITITLGISSTTVNRRLREMGFDGLKDARNVMTS